MTEQTPVEKRPKVSVLMITYNHGKFIEQAVRSVMMQEADFDYELIIGEDCSTDNTRELLLRLKEEFPDKISLLLHPQNIGMIPNMVATYNACTGEYIALCEGDDYWTHPKKLQIQVDYMEAHPDCRISFHSAEIRYENRPDLPIEMSDIPTTDCVDPAILVRKFFVMTATVIFRSVNQSLPPWYLLMRGAGDWQLYTWLLDTGGHACYIRTEPMTVYRKHDGGISHQPNIEAQIARRQDHVSDLRIVINSIHSRSQIKAVKQRLQEHHYHLAELLLKSGRKAEARFHAQQYFKYFLVNRSGIGRALKLVFMCIQHYPNK